MNKVPVPAGVAYAIVLWADGRTAFFTSIEKVVACMVANGIQFDCEVTRVQGDEMVWPFHTKGGEA